MHSAKRIFYSKQNILVTSLLGVLLIPLLADAIKANAEVNRPTTVTYDSIPVERNVFLGVSPIHAGKNGSYDYVTLGKYQGTPIQWRVLDTNTSDGQDGLFLLSEYGLCSTSFGENGTYQESDAKSFCINLYRDSDTFSPTERSLLLSTVKFNPTKYPTTGNDHFYYIDSPVEGERVFLPSVSEMSNVRYGFDDDFKACNARRTTTRAGVEGAYWIRGTYTAHTDNACMITRYGTISNAVARTTAAYLRPAMNITNSSSEIVYSHLLFTDSNGGDHYKLGLMKSSLKAPELNGFHMESNQICVSLYGAPTEANAISLMITDRNLSKLYSYQCLGEKDGFSCDAGNFKFTLPDGLAREDVLLLVFYEQQTSGETPNLVGSSLLLTDNLLDD